MMSTQPSGSEKAKYVEDIRPTATRARAPLGVVELTLGDGATVKAVGVVYGLEHEVTGPGFRTTLFLDQYNQRIKVVCYEATDLGSMILRVRALAEANGLDKIIVMASEGDWLEFLRYGYVLEAVIKEFHDGADAYVVSKFRSQERLASPSLMEEILLIEQIMAAPADYHHPPLPAGYTVRLARYDDVSELIELYRSIFETYPSPLIHESYLRTVFERESLFAVCTYRGDIVAAASAELQPHRRAAELTDCATRRDARRLGLMGHVLRTLERELSEREYRCAYTMARARSYGMNNVFYRLGYAFMGRLVNNCDIYGAYEDMNIWVRMLRAREGVLPQA